MSVFDWVYYIGDIDEYYSTRSNAAHLAIKEARIRHWRKSRMACNMCPHQTLDYDHEHSVADSGKLVSRKLFCICTKTGQKLPPLQYTSVHPHWCPL